MSNTSWSGDRRAFPPRVRRFILRRDPICAAPGCHSPSEVADHIVNVAQARRLGWKDHEINSVSNGQGMCNRCHDEKTKRERIEGQRLKARKRQAEKHPGIVEPD